MSKPIQRTINYHAGSNSSMDMNWHLTCLARFYKNYLPSLKTVTVKGIHLIDKKSGTANTERTRAKKTAMKKER